MKIGTKVKVLSDDSFLSDLQADLEQDCSERKTEEICTAIENGETFVIAAIEKSFGERMYSLKLKRYELPYLFEKERLETVK